MIFRTLGLISILEKNYKYHMKILTESGLFSAEVRCFLGEFEVVVEMRLRLRLRTGEGVIFNLNFLIRKINICKKNEISLKHIYIY